jgi:alpha-L-fucosidase
MLQNQQAATAVYQAYPFGILRIAKPGKHTITVVLVGGDPEKASLERIKLTPAG